MLRLNLNRSLSTCVRSQSSKLFVAAATTVHHQPCCIINNPINYSSFRFAGVTNRASFSRSSVPTSDAKSEEIVDETTTTGDNKDKTATKIEETGEVSTTQTTTDKNQPQESSPETLRPGTPEKPLWENCDTIEDIMEEEKYGAEGEEDQQPPVEPEHVVLAFRAFVWGTFWAFVGVGTISLIAMKMGGFSNIKEVLEYVGSKDKRRLAEMKAEGIEVIEYNVDLTNPSEVPDQLSQVWNHILVTSGAAAEIEQAMKEASEDGENNSNEGEEGKKEEEQKEEKKE